jgi:DNA-binding transcriptional MerR regulator|tara:strand:- start:65 stop:406 length:342 start_codon:yes stop_codon:yes gene_type:complete
LPYREREITKLYYSIGEVAKIFEVNSSLIRFWESEFDILKPKKNKKGNRLFTQKDLAYLKIIYDLVKEKGHTLEGAKRALKDDRNALLEKQELKDRLIKIRSQLVNLLEEISQ